MTDMFIPDPNAPQRVPDGNVGDFYFWLGNDDDETETDDLGNVDDPEFDFGRFDDDQ